MKQKDPPLHIVPFIGTYCQKPGPGGSKTEDRVLLHASYSHPPLLIPTLQNNPLIPNWLLLFLDEEEEGFPAQQCHLPMSFLGMLSPK